MSVKGDVDRILEVFTGADGGIDFVRVRFGLEDIEARSLSTGINSDARSAIELLEVVSRFRRLIDVLSKR